MFDRCEGSRHHGGERGDGDSERREGSDQPVWVREILVLTGRMVMLRFPTRVAAALPMAMLVPVPVGIAVRRRGLQVLTEHMDGTEPQLDRREAHERS